jgi:hypothetical protein
MVAISNNSPKTGHTFFGINAANNRGEKPVYASEKKEIVKIGEIKLMNQKQQLANPDSVITIEVLNHKIGILSKYANPVEGAKTIDITRFRAFFWEIAKNDGTWRYHNSSPENATQDYSGLNYLSYHRDDGGKFFEEVQLYSKNNIKLVGWLCGKSIWGKKGVSISWMSKLPACIYLGSIFDNSSVSIIPDNEDNLGAIYCFLKSKEFYSSIRQINQKNQIATSTFSKVPFDLEHWQKIAAEKYPNGLPKPYSDDPTQWLFHGHPIKTDNPLQVALARVLGYRWPAESDTEMELADEARELINAVKAFDHLSDEDGIFCIPSVNAEQAGSERLRDYLQQVFAGEWNNQTITQLLQKEGAKSTNLEAWLRDEFFVQHCKVFQNRPFIWHIWDGRKDGFSALVNYHKLDKDNLSKLIYTYLNDWIRVCVAKKNAGESGAEGLLSAAQKLKENLEAILHGEAPYDIFVRWKTIEQQPIGWEPDLNDGVRLNIRPFIEADVLRKKPNIKWGVDRGKNPPGSPWGEVRDNDQHLSLEEKRKARETKK